MIVAGVKLEGKKKHLAGIWQFDDERPLHELCTKTQTHRKDGIEDMIEVLRKIKGERIKPSV